MKKIISFQGELGAYGHQACTDTFPNDNYLPCQTFEGAIAAVHDGRADIAMLPVENSTFGRVADIHHLLPNARLKIIGEEFVRVRINLLGLPDAELSDVKLALSHAMALGQARNFLMKHDIHWEVYKDTAGSAKYVASQSDKSIAALASPKAGEIYGLKVLAESIEDVDNNTTRFLVMVPEDYEVAAPSGDTITSFIFEVRNIPAALYKALGGFATNGVNMVKLESYMVDGSFSATQFYAEIEGSPQDNNVALAMDELKFFTKSIKILGVYEAAQYRREIANQ